MAVLQEAIKALDPSPDKKTELTLALQLITELSRGKADQFKEDVATSYRTANTVENRTAPISLVVSEHAEYRAYVKNDGVKIGTEVFEAIKKFVAGGSEGIITGVADLVTTGLNAILGSGEGMEQEMASYFVTVQSRALVRYDVRAWRRSIEAEGITQQIESCLAMYAAKASIDVSKLDLNTFLLGYEDQLFRMGFTDKQTLEYIDYAEEVYRKLVGDKGASVARLREPPDLAPEGTARLGELLNFTPALAVG